MFVGERREQGEWNEKGGSMKEWKKENENKERDGSRS